VNRIWQNRTLRAFVIIAAIAAIVTVAQLEETLSVVGGLLSIAFFLAVAFFLFMLWRERRGDLETWSDHNRRVFYAAIILAVVDIGAVIGLDEGGFGALAFFLVLGACAYAIFRVWRAEHRYS
jgi:Mn2+/Fe2+ NRAMP family transporter